MTTTNTATTERARMATIMALPGAKAHAHLAGQLAVSTRMSPSQINRTLEAASGRGAFAHLDAPPARVGLQSWQRAKMQERAEFATAEEAAAMVLGAGRIAKPAR